MYKFKAGNMIKLNIVNYSYNEKGKEKIKDHDRRLMLAEKEYNKAVDMDLEPEEWLLEELNSELDLKKTDYKETYHEMRLIKSSIEGYNTTVSGVTHVYTKSGLEATVKETVLEIDYKMKPWWSKVIYKIMNKQKI